VARIRPASGDPSVASRTMAMTSLAPRPPAGSGWGVRKRCLGVAVAEAGEAASARGRAARRRRRREAGEERMAVGGEKRARASRAATRGGDRAAAASMA
jgi:hypothetical protein